MAASVGKSARVRSDADVVLVEGGAGKHLGGEGGDAGADLGVDSIAGKWGRDGHQLANELGVPHGEPQGDLTALAVAEEVGLVEAEVVDQGGDIVGQLVEAERTVDVGVCVHALAGQRQ